MKKMLVMEKGSPLLLLGLFIAIAIIGTVIASMNTKTWRNTVPTSSDFYKSALNAFLENDRVTAKSMVVVALTFDPENVEARRLRDRLGEVASFGHPNEVKETIERMRGLSMQMNPGVKSDGTIEPTEKEKQGIILALSHFGERAVLALALALNDTDVQMKRNAGLALMHLAGGHLVQPKIDIRGAVPALIRATEDVDPDVRTWAAGALAEVGPDAKDAISSLVRLLNDTEEGPRNNSCIALGRMGPAAIEALPALRKATNDSSQDMRRFSQKAIEEIQK